MIEFLFLCSKITADGDCSHDLIRWLLLGRKAMTNLDSVLNSRHYSADKICIVQAMVFPVVMYSCESWTLRQAEHQRIDAFEWWCWKTPESPLNSKEIKPVNFMAHQPWAFTRRTEAPVIWSSNANMTCWKSPWYCERLWVEGELGIKGWDACTASRMQWTWTWTNSGKWWGTGRPVVLQPMGLQRVGHNWKQILC